MLNIKIIKNISSYKCLHILWPVFLVSPTKIESEKLLVAPGTDLGLSIAKPRALSDSCHFFIWRSAFLAQFFKWFYNDCNNNKCMTWYKNEPLIVQLMVVGTGKLNLKQEIYWGHQPISSLSYVIYLRNFLIDDYFSSFQRIKRIYY